MANNLFNMLASGLRKASVKPAHDTLAMGFTTQQIFTGRMKKPRLIWYDAKTQTYYDQGDSTKIKKSQYSKINATNFKKDKPINDLGYYIPINQEIINESDKPLN